MGYYNPIYIYGNERFLADAKAAGVDGLIVVDLPPEEDEELCIPAMKAGLNFIRLATPTTDDQRLPAVLENTSGFVYYVSITGITGTKTPDNLRVAEAVDRIKRHTDLPVAVGFGVNTPEQAAAIGRNADGVVVGSALVRAVETSLDGEKRATAGDRRGGDRSRRGAGARRARLPPDGGRIEEDLRVGKLDRKRRPPENPLAVDQARDAGESLGEMPGDGRDGVPQGSGGEPVRLSRIPAITSASTRARGFRLFFDDGVVGHAAAAAGAGRSAALPRRAPLHRAAEGGEGEDRPRGRGHARRRHGRRACRSSPRCRISTSWAARSAWPPPRRSSPAPRPRSSGSSPTCSSPARAARACRRASSR